MLKNLKADNIYIVCGHTDMHLLTVLPEWGRNPADEQLESVMPWSESLPDFCRQEYDEIRQ